MRGRMSKEASFPGAIQRCCCEHERVFPVEGESMGAITVSRFETPSVKLIAPWWHTALLVTLFLGMAVGGAFFQRHTRSDPGMLQQHPQVAWLYLSLIIMEWGLFVRVWRGYTVCRLRTPRRTDSETL
jgi:hypothetical protein